MDGDLVRAGPGISPDLADVPAVTRGHPRAAKKGEREGSQILEGRNGKHRLVPRKGDIGTRLCWRNAVTAGLAAVSVGATCWPRRNGERRDAIDTTR